MDRTSAELFSRKLGIAVEQIVREELEIAFLRPLRHWRLIDRWTG